MREETDFWGVVLRREDLRRAVAAGVAGKLDKHVGVIARVAQQIYRHHINRPVFQAAGVGLEDVQQFCRVQALNWLGNAERWYKRPVGQEEAARLINRHCVQKGGAFVVALAKYGLRSGEGFGGRRSFLVADLYAERAALAKHGGESVKSGLQNESVDRRAASKQLLLAGLAGLDHAAAVDRLARVLASPALDADSKKAGARLLVKLRACSTAKPCPVCEERAVGQERAPEAMPGRKVTLAAPMVDSLPSVRAFVARVAELDHSVVRREGVQEKSGQRYMQLHRQAALLLGAVKLRAGALSAAPGGRGWLATEEGSVGERAHLRALVAASRSLARLRWFLLEEEADEVRLESQLVQEDGRWVRCGARDPASEKHPDHCQTCGERGKVWKLGARTTAARRVRTLRCWRRYINNRKAAV